MKDILIYTDKDGGTAVLTIVSPVSHYGIPVLRIEADDINGDFGPSDIISLTPKPYTAADVVAGWATQDGRTDDELTSARKFLAQWPDGPQLWGGKREGAGRPATGRKRQSFYVTDEENKKLREYLEKIRD